MFCSLFEQILMQETLEQQPRVAEMMEHFRNGDTDLGRRRFLDLAYDQGDDAILAKATTISQDFHQSSDAERLQKDAEHLCASFTNRKNQNDSSEPLVVANKISKAYNTGGFQLNHINIAVYPGSILGVVGENGNGKTTLLRCLGGQLDGGIPQEAYGYIPESNQHYYSLKQYTGFIPQRIPKWYGKLKDNLHFSASISGFFGEKNKILVDFILERFGLAQYAELTWNQISSGYRTRFEIARIVLQRPKLLILDEPLANLDINAQQTLLQDLKFIAKSELHPLGLIISSQQLYEIEKVSDKVLFISKGIGKYNHDEVHEEATDSATTEPVAKIHVIEFECPASRAAIEKSLEGHIVEIKFNGGVYQVTSGSNSATLLKQLMASDIVPVYFRDISLSTKRFF